MITISVKSISNFSIIGFGNQAKAWALNLRDSGVDVHIGLRSNSASIESCKKLGFHFFDFTKQEIPTKHVAILAPDEAHPKILEIISNFNSHLCCIYAHGFSLNKDQLQLGYPHFEHILLAPKSIASELRFSYETGKNIGAIYSLEFAKTTSKESLTQIANKIGITSIFPATFKQETEADLFSEQTLLCSLLPYAANAAFNTLRAQGYPKELCFYECFYEVKLIADALLKFGPEKFFDLISPNALIGSQVGTHALINKTFEDNLSQILDNIKMNKFDTVIENTDINELKKDVNTFWKNQELTQVYEQLKDSL